MRSSRFLSLVAICSIASALPQPADAADARPAQISAQITRLMNVKPGPSTNLASTRQVALTNSGGSQIKTLAIKKLLASMTGPKRAEVLGYDPRTDFGIQPVAYMPAAYAPRMVAADINGARIRYVRDPEISATTDGVAINIGTAIIEARRRLSIHLPEGRIDLKRGAAIKLSSLNGTYRVVNIVDDGPDSVTLHVCRRHLSLRPGQEARYSLDKELVAQRIYDGCGRRNEWDQSCCTYAIKLDEISVAALLKHDAIGKQIYVSSDRNDHALAQRITKLAAALAFWTKTKNPYIWD